MVPLAEPAAEIDPQPGLVGGGGHQAREFIPGRLVLRLNLAGPSHEGQLAGTRDGVLAADQPVGFPESGLIPQLLLPVIGRPREHSGQDLLDHGRVSLLRGLQGPAGLVRLADLMEDRGMERPEVKLVLGLHRLHDFLLRLGVPARTEVGIRQPMM